MYDSDKAMAFDMLMQQDAEHVVDILVNHTHALNARISGLEYLEPQLLAAELANKEMLRSLIDVRDRCETLEAQIDRLEKQADGWRDKLSNVISPKGLRDIVEADRSKKLEEIKRVRSASDMSLKQAKDLVEFIWELTEDLP